MSLARWSRHHTAAGRAAVREELAALEAKAAPKPTPTPPAGPTVDLALSAALSRQWDATITAETEQGIDGLTLRGPGDTLAKIGERYAGGRFIPSFTKFVALSGKQAAVLRRDVAESEARAKVGG